MAKVSTNITIDAEVKKQAQKLFSDLGMDLSTAINIYLKKALQYKGIPFDVCIETPNAETVAVLAEAERGENLHGPFDSIEELKRALDAED